MRVLCSTFGSSGDVFPMLGLAMELQRQGHEVILATNDYYAPLTQRHGIPFEAVGSAEEFRAAAAHPDLWNPRRSFSHLYRHLFPVMRTQYELHERLLRQGPFIAVSNCLSFGARLAQEKLGIPMLTVHLQPVVFQSRIEPPYLGSLLGPKWLRHLAFRLGERLIIDRAVCPSLNAWRRELNLPPVRRVCNWWHSPQGLLCMFPQWYAAPQSDWPGPLQQTDFPLWNDNSQSELPAEVRQFLEAGEKPIVLAPGSMNLQGRAFFAQAVSACASLNRRAILLTEFPEQLPESLPKSMAHFSYVPLDLLLPHVAMIVHHGGIGTTSQAMLAGIPQIAMPMAYDQFDNAVRLIRLKIGLAIPATRFTALRLRRAVTQLLDSSEVATNCRLVAERMQHRTGLLQSAAAVTKQAPKSNDSPNR